MILVDSSVSIDHIRSGVPGLFKFLEVDLALMPPHVLGEVALGSIGQRSQVLARLEILPAACLAEEQHVLHLIDVQA